MDMNNTGSSRIRKMMMMVLHTATNCDSEIVEHQHGIELDEMRSIPVAPTKDQSDFDILKPDRGSDDLQINAGEEKVYTDLVPVKAAHLPQSIRLPLATCTNCEGTSGALCNTSTMASETSSQEKNVDRGKQSGALEEFVCDSDISELVHFEKRDVPEIETTEDSTESEHATLRVESDVADRSQSKERKRQPELWKANIKKSRVNLGQTYLTVTNKETVAKSVRGVCGKKCRLQCPTKITEERQAEINKSYWQLGDHGLQRNFVLSHSQKVQPRYRYSKEGSQRGCNIAYYFLVDGNKIRVCKQFFMKTLDVGDKFIRNCWNKVDEHGVLEKEKRGKHTKHNVDEALKEQVRNHIRSFPRTVSHYLRAQTSKEYLDGSLTVAEMYRLYLENQAKSGLPSVKLSLYREIFNTDFNLSFFVPKKDQYALCESYKNASDEEKEQKRAMYEDHCRNKLLSREEKSKDSVLAKEGSLTVSCFDLQAVLQAPCGDISVLYYKRKLNCYNFTVYYIGKKEGYCFFWNESIANRGVNEIGTCVLTFLEEHCQNQRVVFYSDNADGQNKNKFIASLYLFAVQTLSIPQITHKYLIAGHTQNEGDSMHSTIEKQKARSLKSGPIYTPTQWVPLIQLAKKEGKPYVVRELATEDIKDFKQLAKNMGKNFTVNEDGQKVNWNSFKIIETRKDSPNVLFYKTDYEDQDFKTIHVRGKLRGRPSLPLLEQAYSCPPKISLSKLKDLLDLCSAGVIPRVHHQFFKSLQAHDQNEEDRQADLTEADYQCEEL